MYRNPESHRISVLAAESLAQFQTILRVHRDNNYGEATMPSLEVVIIRSSGKTYELAKENFSKEMECWERENGRRLADAQSSTIQIKEEWREFIPSAPKPSKIKVVAIFLFPTG